ncbi:L-3-cyanoalanine synthase 1 [Spatholobus suberectus]|nr:L-3-cyanoalanine synthase 1 [Spatholobus suberectus]
MMTTTMFSAQPIIASSAAAQRIRDVPNDLPTTNIKNHVSHCCRLQRLSVAYSSAHSPVTEGCGAYVVAKQEMMQPTSSVKNRSEIWEDTNGQVSIFVTGVGGGGTIIGVGQYLKSKNPNVKIYGVEPAESNVLNGGKPGLHQITSTGVGFKTDILDMDRLEKVSSEDAINMARKLALEEGLLVEISSGANTVAALKLASMAENKRKFIVTVHPSFGERYLSFVLSKSFGKRLKT